MFCWGLAADLQPPRKGCDEAFLEQLLRFKPLTVVYVSCNVHTQARDLGWFLQVGKMRGINYTLESLRGFDLFPQVCYAVLGPVHELILDCPCRGCCSASAGRIGRLYDAMQQIQCDSTTLQARLHWTYHTPGFLSSSSCLSFSPFDTTDVLLLHNHPAVAVWLGAVV